MKKLVMASNNAGKLREFKNLLVGAGFDVLAQADFGIESVEETGLSFVENAILKARHASKMTQLPAIADDSGIEVDALNGRPGIYSARFAGEGANDEDNNKKLLEALNGLEGNQRSARYQCVLVYMRHCSDPTPIIAHGQWEGLILETPRGEGGFGYDPLFWVPTHQCASAELNKEEKNTISHRAVAMQRLLKALAEEVTRNNDQ